MWLPFLGLWFGHQLVAEALGGEVGKSVVPEIRVMDVQLTEKGATRVFLDCIPSLFQCSQWHGVEAKRLARGGSGSSDIFRLCSPGYVLGT